MVFCGVSNGIQRITSDIRFLVSDHANVDSTVGNPTPSEWEQFVDAVKESADAAKLAESNANDYRVSAKQSADAANQSAEEARNFAETAGENSDDAIVKVNEARDEAIDYVNSEGNKKIQEIQDVNAEILQEAKDAANSASESASTANSSAASAKNYASEAENSLISSASSSTISQSWAVGGTGTRAGEDTNNSKYWCNLAQTISQGALGWYENEEALKSVHPTGQNGQWAIIGTTDTIWTWDSDTGTWVDSGAQIDLSNYYTVSQADARFQMPVGYIFDWAPVEGQNVDLSTPEKVAAHFGYGTWQELNGVFTFARNETHEVGSTGGEAEVQLTADQNGPHSHGAPGGGSLIVWGGTTGYIEAHSGVDMGSQSNTAASGKGAPHNNMPPYLTVYKWQRIA